MFNKRGQVWTEKGFIVGMLLLTLFVGTMATVITFLGEDGGDLTGYDGSELTPYTDYGESLAEEINKTYTQVDEVTINPNLFDYFAGIFDKLLSPLKLLWRAAVDATTLIGDVAGKLKLFPIFGTVMVTLIILYVMFRVLKHLGIIRD